MPSARGVLLPAPSGERRIVDEEAAARGVGDHVGARPARDRAMGARDEQVRVVDLPVGLGAAADHQLAGVEPHLAHRLRLRRALKGEEQGHAVGPRRFWTIADQRPHQEIAGIRRAAGGASQLVRPSRLAPSRAAGTSAVAQHRTDVDVEAGARKVAAVRTSAGRAAGRRAGTSRSRANVSGPSRVRSGSAAGRCAARSTPSLPRRGVGAAEAGLQRRRNRHPGADELDRDAPARRSASRRTPVSRSGPSTWWASAAACRRRTRSRPSTDSPRPAADAGHGGEHGPVRPPPSRSTWTAGGRRPRPGSRAPACRCCSTLAKSRKVVSLVARVAGGGEPALRQPVEHPAGEVQRHRPFRPEQAERGQRDLGRRLAVGRLERRHVAQREAEARLLAEARRLAIRPAALAETAARRAPARAGARRSRTISGGGAAAFVRSGRGCRASSAMAPPPVSERARVRVRTKPLMAA